MPPSGRIFAHAPFDGFRVIVTGGASGIGAACVSALGDEGAQVITFDKKKPGTSGRHCIVDVSDRDAVDRAVARAVSDLGGLDLLVNSAGYPVTKAGMDLSDREWRDHFEADVHGIRSMCDACRPHLERSRGAIVNVTSAAGLGGDKGMEAYDAAKGAAVQLTRAMAIDLGPSGIRVNAVCPTVTRTAMSKDVEARADKMHALEEAIPLGRIGEAEEVAAAILFLGGPAASYVSGVCLPVDGGVTAWNGQPSLA